MQLKKKPVTGMKDILPEEMEIRDYVISIIKKTYRDFGFSSIETPCVEDINNLSSKQGGENEKLIFKILKRGKKLNLLEAKEELDVVDGGLRYDLTVPLVRYYANNLDSLPKPFKSLQMGNVWRADRPQRGRYRQFMQCDIDILGEPSNIAEIELILATTTTLSKLGFRGFEVRINDRNILKAMAKYSGFEETSFDLVFIILDKMDKIGEDGVEKELIEAGFKEESAKKYLNIYRNMKKSNQVMEYLFMELEEYLEDDVKESMRQIMQGVNEIKSADFTLIFDPTLVRGMGYYTGPIFEIAIPEFGGSCGGGGRYDGMIKKFTGQDIPACGFSIGFERIVLLLLENGFQIPKKHKKIAFLIDSKYTTEKLCEVMKEAANLREEGKQVIVVKMIKNKKFQKEQLKEQGYEEIKEFYMDFL